MLKNTLKRHDLFKLHRYIKKQMNDKAKTYVKSKPNWILEIKHHFKYQKNAWPLNYHAYLQYSGLANFPELFLASLHIINYKVVYNNGTLLIVGRKK